jgi:hypothetical protein
MDVHLYLCYVCWQALLMLAICFRIWATIFRGGRITCWCCFWHSTVALLVTGCFLLPQLWRVHKKATFFLVTWSRPWLSHNMEWISCQIVSTAMIGWCLLWCPHVRSQLLWLDHEDRNMVSPPDRYQPWSCFLCQSGLCFDTFSGLELGNLITVSYAVLKLHSTQLYGSWIWFSCQWTVVWQLCCNTENHNKSSVVKQFASPEGCYQLCPGRNLGWRWSGS